MLYNGTYIISNQLLNETNVCIIIVTSLLFRSITLKYICHKSITMSLQTMITFLYNVLCIQKCFTIYSIDDEIDMFLLPSCLSLFDASFDELR